MKVWKYFLINLFLAALVLFLIFKLYGIWTTPMGEVHPPLKKIDLEKEKVDIAEAKKDKRDYQEIVQKDLFRPSRTEFKPEDTKTGPSSPPPMLFGTMIMDNDRIAIIQDPVTKRSKVYRLKDRVGDLIVSEIEKDKIIFLRGEEKVVVGLRETKIISMPPRSRVAPPRVTPRPVPTELTPGTVPTRPFPEPVPVPPQGTTVPVEPQNNLLWHSY